MNANTIPQFADVRGSWETVFEEANRLAANFNDDAIPRYEKVFSGLVRIPPRLRRANNGRLQALLIRAGLALHAYLNFRDRYTESLATLRALLDEVEDDDDREMIESQILDVLIQSKQYDEALTTARDLADEDPDDVYNWGRAALVSTRVGKADQAWQFVDRMRATASDQLDGDVHIIDFESLERDKQQLLSYYFGVDTIVAIENEDYDHAITAIDSVLAFEGLYAQNLPVFYTRLIARQKYDLALTLIDKDTIAPVRSGYWRGLVHKLQGRDQEAERIWRDVLGKLPKQRDDAQAMPENVSPTEFIMTHYQLGDTEGAALGIVLRSIREGQNTGWVQFMLAGLGWALRGDRKTAKSDLDIAVARYKSSADGSVLPIQYWWTVETLFDDETQVWLRPYFQTELPPSQTAPAPDSKP